MHLSEIMPIFAASELHSDYPGRIPSGVSLHRPCSVLKSPSGGFCIYCFSLLNQCYLMHVAMIPVATLILLPDFLAKHVVHRELARAVSIQILQHESPLPIVLFLDVCLAFLLIVADVVGHGFPVHAVLLFVGALPDVLCLLPQLYFYGRFGKAQTSLTLLSPFRHFATLPH